MDPTDIGLFRLAERRMSWIDQRQSVLSQNVVNANTPGFAARDLTPFAAKPRHLPGTNPAVNGREQPSDGRAPNGNTVSMEEQLGKVAETSSSQELVANLHHKYQGLFSIVLGRNG